MFLHLFTTKKKYSIYKTIYLFIYFFFYNSNNKILTSISFLFSFYSFLGTAATMEATNCSDDEEPKTEFDGLNEYKEILCDFPEVLKYISKLHDHIKWQRKKINKLRNKLTGCVRNSIALSNV